MPAAAAGPRRPTTCRAKCCPECSLPPHAGALAAYRDLPYADPPAAEYITQRPQRTPTVQADVLVPALQAALTALAAALAGLHDYLGTDDFVAWDTQEYIPKSTTGESWADDDLKRLLGMFPHRGALGGPAGPVQGPVFG